MNLARIKEYYRQKRIRRILTFYSFLQSYGLINLGPHPVDLRSPNKNVLISRDAKFHFVLTLILLGVCGSVLGMLVRPIVGLLPKGTAPAFAQAFLVGLPTAFLSVEIADAILLKTTRVLDVLIDLILPVVGLIAISAVFLGVTQFNMGPQWSKQFNDWKDRTNERIQKRPRALPLSQPSGNNWALIVDDKNQLLPLTRPEAHRACLEKGGDWQLFDGDAKFQPDPVPIFSGQFSVWMAEGGFPVGQVGGTNGFGKPSVFSSASMNDRVPTLCVRKAAP